MRGGCWGHGWVSASGTAPPLLEKQHHPNFCLLFLAVKISWGMKRNIGGFQRARQTHAVSAHTPLPSAYGHNGYP